jgi:hypothetical protein
MNRQNGCETLGLNVEDMRKTDNDETGNNLRRKGMSDETRLTKQEWNTLHTKLFQQTKDKFFESLEQFDGFNWPVPRIMFWILNYYNLTLDQAMTDEIRQIAVDDAKAEALMEDDEDEDDEHEVAAQALGFPPSLQAVARVRRKEGPVQ